jgi:RNA polymerase sigma-70 factor (ECF subfamily)
MQQICLHALNKHTLFEEGTNFSAWLYVIGRNYFFGNLRKEETRHNFANDYMLRTLPSATLQTSDLVEAECGVAASQEDSVDLHRTLEELKSDILAGNLLWRLGLGYGFQEISEELDIPAGTVKSRIFRGQEKLRKKLGALLE